jgi:hypothetical protein
LTRVRKNGGQLIPTEQNQDGSTNFVPESVFSFTTVFGVKMEKHGAAKVVWTLAKDRAESNLWTPVAGGEDDYPIQEQSKQYGLFDFGQNTGLREAMEESGVEIKLWSTGPFWICAMPYGYPDYTIITQMGEKDPVTVKGVHTILYYYMGEIIGEPKLCNQKGAEHQFRNVDMKILSIAESFEAFKNGSMDAYASIKEAFCRFAWIMRQAENPFAQVYPKNWAEEEGLMERTWKNNFITL